MTTCCILLAAGAGARFGAAKQFEVVGGRRLVDHAVEVAAEACDDVVLVLPAGATWDGQPVTAVVPGGASRAASVRSGVAAVPQGADVVLVHDAAHPLATPALHRSVVDAVRGGAAAASPSVPVAEALLRRDGDAAVGTVPKDDLVLSQTPHGFRADVLRALVAEDHGASDEITLLVSRGTPVALVAGEPTNVHVASRDDLALAARLLADGQR